MRDRISTKRPSGEEMLREMRDLTSALGLKEGQTVFIKRSAESQSGKAGEIDEGWSILRSDPKDPDTVMIAKVESGENAAHSRTVNNLELVRLNTGRNRGALEYVFKMGDTPERTNLLSAVDSADDSVEARDTLTAFFRQEALTKAQKLFKGTPVRLKARTFEEMVEEIGKHLHAAEDTTLQNLQQDVQELSSLIDLAGQFKG